MKSYFETILYQFLKSKLKELNTQNKNTHDFPTDLSL